MFFILCFKSNPCTLIIQNKTPLKLAKSKKKSNTYDVIILVGKRNTRERLTGTESWAERSEAVLLEKTESEACNDSESVVQMAGKAAAESATDKPASISSSLGKSRRSSMWSKKLPQSISSTKFVGPIIFSYLFFKKI